MKMQTDELINILAQVPPAKRPLRLEALTLLLVILAGLATTVILGVRPELPAGPPSASFWLKTALLGAMLGVALHEVRLASRPVEPARDRSWPAMLLLAVTGMLLCDEWLTVDHREILQSFLLPNFRCCLLSETAYGAIGMIAMTWLMRRYAPGNTTRCAGLIGIVAAAAGGLGYSIHCPIDSPTFIVIAYGIPMVVLWFVCRLILPRFLRW